LLFLTGCAVRGQVKEEKTSVPLQAAAAHPVREMLVYVPLADDSAAAWARWFVKYPGLRMVIAMSPRFQHIAKDPHLKAQFQTLQKDGRLEIAMQVPNAPLLPLLVDAPYAYPDDVVQLIAQTKADFFRQWNFLPRGFVLPYGAANPKLVSLLETLGFSWIVAALEAPAVDGPYRSGSLQIWDGAPASPPAPLPKGEGGRRPGEATIVKVWDEREMKEKPLDAWIQEIVQKNRTFLMPSDPGIEAGPLASGIAWKSRTWEQADLSSWIGPPAKNAGWDALRKTREALEAYKNSGQASLQRLDAAFSEIYGAQNSNYFASMGNTAQSPALVEERQHEFQATLLAVYRLIGRQPPEDLFQPTVAGDESRVRPSSTTTRAEVLPDGREHIVIEDAVGDAMGGPPWNGEPRPLGGPGAPDLVSLEVWSSTVSVQWIVTLATMTPASVDIYVDLNGQPNAGTPTFLPGRGYNTSPIDAWEYALALSGPTATLYRTQGMGTYAPVQMFPVVVEGNKFRVTVPAEMMRGSPRRWGYQVLVMSAGPARSLIITDFIDPLEISQKELWKALSTGQRTDIPFIRIRSK
jgi:hypothetical protein